LSFLNVAVCCLTVDVFKLNERFPAKRGRNLPTDQRSACTKTGAATGSTTSELPQVQDVVLHIPTWGAIFISAGAWADITRLAKEALAQANRSSMV
jgi:hypothetical protein